MTRDASKFATIGVPNPEKAPPDALLTTTTAATPAGLQATDPVPPLSLEQIESDTSPDMKRAENEHT